MIGIPLGLLYANAVEWVVHKHVLHGLGKDRKSFWAFHWHEHHGNVRKNDHIDPTYERPLLGGWHAQSKEALALALATAAHLPLAPVAPFFTATLVYSAVDYYRKHKRSHQDPTWAREHLPWHVDHHLGPNQDANWCVTHPWMDVLMGTREPYVGTEREARDQARRAERAERRAARAGPPEASAAPPTAAPAVAVAA